METVGGLHTQARMSDQVTMIALQTQGQEEGEEQVGMVSKRMGDSFRYSKEASLTNSSQQGAGTYLRLLCLTQTLRGNRKYFWERESGSESPSWNCLNSKVP